MTIRELIVQERNAWKTITPCWVLQEFILRHGQEFVSQPLPKRFKMRRAKQCWWNAYQVMKQSKGRLLYAEGYVCDEFVPFLVHHGWCVDRENRVVDPTLQEIGSLVSRSGQAQYYGIIFHKPWLPRGGGSVLNGRRGYNIETWLRFDPSFIEVIKEAEKGAAVQ